MSPLREEGPRPGAVSLGSAHGGLELWLVCVVCPAPAGLETEPLGSGGLCGLGADVSAVTSGDKWTVTTRAPVPMNAGEREVGVISDGDWISCLRERRGSETDGT